MKNHQAGAIALAQRVDALEKAQIEASKRIEALLMVIEKIQEAPLQKQFNVRDPHSGETVPEYQPVFDRWPGNAR